MDDEDSGEDDDLEQVALETLGEPVGVATPTELRLTQDKNRRTIVGWLTILLGIIIVGCLGLVGSHRVSVDQGLQLIGGLSPLVTGLLGVAVASYFDWRSKDPRDDRGHRL
ncbi:MAG: hypothetical protein M3083_24800 [Actinomycetota bacterium]|nr:hypothetical protein [Actinomycetota bacterium]